MEKTILIVEDEKILCETIADNLQAENFLTIKALNGREGVELALAKHPDLILLDLLMPEMDGMTALKKIRQDAWGANVPVIVLTNLSAIEKQLVEDVATLKPLYYLVKSDFKIDDVIKKIKEALKT